MLAVPTMYQAPRGVVLLLLLLCSLKLKEYAIPKYITHSWLLNMMVIFIAFIIGIFEYNPGTLACAPFYLIWPALYIYFMRKIPSQDFLYNMIRCIVYYGFIPILLNLGFFINDAFVHIGIISMLAENLGYKFGLYEGFTETFSYTQSYLTYYLFFSVTLLLVPSAKLGIERKWLYVMAVLSLILILISGRRAMWVVCAAMPLIILVFLRATKQSVSKILKMLSISVLGCALIALGFYLFYDVESMSNEFMSAFDMYENESNYERTLQGNSLINDFKNNPVFGRGLGYASQYIRTPNAPWGYELTYHYLLGGFGLVGMAALCFTYLNVIIRSIKVVRRKPQLSEIVVPPLTGVTSFLIINGTNPYMMTFDLVWIFFLPIIIMSRINKIGVVNEKK